MPVPLGGSRGGLPTQLRNVIVVFAVVFANNPRSRLLLKIAALVLWVTVVYYATFAETAPFKSVSADAIGNG